MDGAPVRGFAVPALPRVVWPSLVRWLRLWRDFTPTTRGSIWVLASAVFFTAMATLAKLLGQRLEALEVAFFRTLIGLIVILPFLLRSGAQSFRSRRPLTQLWRGIVGNLGMMCGFYALVHLPLADANAISFARSLFLIPLAMLVLGETVGVRRLTATALGFVGVLIMLRPGGSIEPAALIAVLGAFFVADAIIAVKILTRYDSTVTLLFYSSVIGTIFLALLLLGGSVAAQVWGIEIRALMWTPPTLGEYGLLIAMGVVGVIAHNCFIRGYAIADATVLNPIDYSRLVFSAIAGFFVFGDVPDGWTIVGAALIVATTLYIARREAALAKAAPPIDPEDAGVDALNAPRAGKTGAPQAGSG